MRLQKSNINCYSFVKKTKKQNDHNILHYAYPITAEASSFDLLLLLLTGVVEATYAWKEVSCLERGKFNSKYRK